MKRKFTLLLAALLLLGINAMTAFGQTTYEKVTSEPTDWSGEYLLVYENSDTEAYAWTGVDAANGYAQYDISNGKITATDAVTITIAPMTEGYSIKINGSTNDGQYIYRTSDSNGITFGSSEVKNDLSLDGTSVKITSSSAVMRFNKTSGQMRFRYFKSSTYTAQQPVQLYKKVEGGGGSVETVSTPSITPNGGTFFNTQEVTISCATEGATIYYTLDETEPSEASNLYSEPFTILTTMTVKAKAFKNGFNESNVASAIFTKIEKSTIAEAKALSTNEYALVEGVVIFIDGRNIYIQDETAGIDLFLNNNTVPSELMLGDKVRTYGKKAVYKGLIELSGIDGSDDSQFSILSSGNELPLAVKTISEINDDYAYGNVLQSTRVMIQNAIIGEINTAGNTTLTQGDNSTIIYKIPTLSDISAGNYVNVIGIISCYNAVQIRVANESDITLVPGEIVLSPSSLLFEYQELNGPSPVEAFNISGEYINGNLDIIASDNFEVCTTESGMFNDTISIAATNGTVNTTVYARMKADLVEGTYSGSITAKNGETTANIILSGTVTEASSAAIPTFTPAAGTYIIPQSVVINCATEGSTIYFTTDGSDPTTSSNIYSEAININQTTTIKAMAVMTGMNNSNIATATYTFPEATAIADVRALNANEYACISGIVTFIDGRNIYVQDETAGIVVYVDKNSAPEGLAIGDGIKAYGKRSDYKGLAELIGVNANNGTIIITSSGNELPLAVKSIEEINTDFANGNMLQSTRIQIEDAIIGEINNNGNTTISQGENALDIYKMPFVEGIIPTDNVTVIGIISCYNTLQLRVNSPEDIDYEHVPTIFTSTTNLTGIKYEIGNGPSESKVLSVGGSYLNGPLKIYRSENFEISSTGDDNYKPQNRIKVNGAYGCFHDINIYVRLKADLPIGIYSDSLRLESEGVEDIYVHVTGEVKEQGATEAEYVRISDISSIEDGAMIIFAARHDDVENSYYAMTATASGKPAGFLFTSEEGADGETLSSEILDNEDTYSWTAGVTENGFTFTNTNGDVLGYSGSGTDFANGGDNTEWTIEYGISDDAAMVPSYGAFVITNVNNSGRAFAINSNYHSFGSYSKTNMTGGNAANYNFYIDMFVKTGGVPTVASPTFTPGSGTYFDAQTVVIACTTPDATIYFTTDGTEPTTNSTVYSEPIEVAESMTIKALAVKEGFQDSNVATAEYTIILGATTIFSQDWEGEMNGWTFVSVTGSNAWNIASYNNNKYANANGYGGGVNEQWCISPAFNINNYSNVSLSFMNATKYTGPVLELMITNNYDGQNPGTATWQPLEFTLSGGNYEWVESGIISLDGINGDNCYIGFKYTSTETEAASWEIDDITLIGFTSNPNINVTPMSLSFSYTEGNGPSAEQSINISAVNLSENIVLGLASTSFEMSLTSGDEFTAQSSITLSPASGIVEQTVYIRMAANLAVNNYEGSVTINSQLDEITVTLNGNVVEQGEDWNRIYSLSELTDGSHVILAARYDETIGNGYYAMPAVVTGKPDGVLFTSETNGGIEKLPAAIADDADTYLWEVTIEDGFITLTNVEGQALGYAGSSTNFAANQYMQWAVSLETSEANAMIPNYSGFVFRNTDYDTRGIAMNSSNKFGAYSTTNIASSDYNFFLDLFVQGGSVTPTVGTPTFSMASGTYYNEIDVEIACATEDATIYYTTDGSEPSSESNVYTEAIHVDSEMTIKAIAVKEGYSNSNVASAYYNVITDVEVILSQDWEGDMDGWSFVTVNGNKPWTIATYAGNKYANANGYGDDVDNEQWCISPEFNLSEHAGQNVILSFMNATKFEGPALELFFSNDFDGQDVTSATWQPLTFNMSEGNYEWAESGDISLNAFSGMICYIAFKYTSNLTDGAAAWEIDDIMLYASLSSEPYITATPNSLNGFEYFVGEGPSELQHFVLTAGNLVGEDGSDSGVITLNINTQNDFEMSLDEETFTTSVEIPFENGTVEPTNIFVRLNAIDVDTYESAVVIAGSGVEIEVPLSGTVQMHTGIEEVNESDVVILSVRNSFIINNNTNNTLEMSVYNIAGQPVIRETLAVGDNVINHDLRNGAYIIRVCNNNIVKNVKVIVER
ncbi:MAG: chitobiase/beta-hexosaminidase C-terminal domain-containing protein [Candidatus Limimorpha sp.]